MATKIFVNLPVKDLKKSMDFFRAIGYTFNPQFTDDTAACMVISEDIYAMLLTHAKYKEFVKKEIADATKTSEVILALSVDDKDAVNSTMTKALAGGATEPRAAQDHGFMFLRTFEDPDGHIWEIFWMDENAVPKPETAQTA
jgi:uncharacterized protein